MYSGTSEFMTAFIGSGRPLDPERYFFVLPDQFGAGASSAASNTPAPFNQGAPPVAISDDVRAQRRLLPNEFGEHLGEPRW